MANVAKIDKKVSYARGTRSVTKKNGYRRTQGFGGSPGARQAHSSRSHIYLVASNSVLLRKTGAAGGGDSDGKERLKLLAWLIDTVTI